MNKKVVNKEIDKAYKQAIERLQCLPAYYQNVDNKIKKNKAFTFIEQNFENKIAFILLVKHAFSFCDFSKITKKIFVESFCKEYKKYSLK